MAWWWVNNARLNHVLELLSVWSIAFSPSNESEETQYQLLYPNLFCANINKLSCEMTQFLVKPFIIMQHISDCIQQ